MDRLIVNYVGVNLVIVVEFTLVIVSHWLSWEFDEVHEPVDQANIPTIDVILSIQNFQNNIDPI